MVKAHLRPPGLRFPIREHQGSAPRQAMQPVGKSLVRGHARLLSLLTGPGRRRWVQAAEGIQLPGGQGRRCGLWRPLRAEKRRAAPAWRAGQGGGLDWPCWAQGYVTGEKGNESPPLGRGAARGECEDTATGTGDNGGKWEECGPGCSSAAPLWPLTLDPAEGSWLGRQGREGMG